MRAPDGTLTPGSEVGGYRIRRVLGRGGFGVTYEAENDLGDRVALKEFLPLGAAPEDIGTTYKREEVQSIRAWALARFRETAIDLRRLSHPNIVRVLHYIGAEDSGFMVMELVEGQTLSGMIRDGGGRMPLPALRRYIEPVMDALAYVHGTGRVHRDVAPDNIMIRADDSPVLIDFGAVKAIERDVVQREQEVGFTRATAQTYAVFKKFYSAPEQAAARVGITPATDVYALGAVMYRALAGQPPPDGIDRKDAVSLEGVDPYVPLSQAIGPGIDPRTAAAIDHALAMRMDQRVGGMEALRAELGWGEALPADAGYAEAPTALAPASPPPSRPWKPAPLPSAVGGPLYTSPPKPVLSGVVPPPPPPSAPGQAGFEPPPRRRSRSALPLVAGLAAAVALVFGVVVIYSRGPSAPTTAVVAQNTAPPPAVSSASPPVSPPPPTAVTPPPAPATPALPPSVARPPGPSPAVPATPTARPTPATPPVASAPPASPPSQPPTPIRPRIVAPEAPDAAVLLRTRRVPQQQRQDFDLLNATGLPIQAVNVSPASSSAWGANLLGADFLVAGETLQLRFAPGGTECLWDIRVRYSDSREADQRNIDLCQLGTVTLRIDGTDGRTLFAR